MRVLLVVCLCGICLGLWLFALLEGGNGVPRISSRIDWPGALRTLTATNDWTVEQWREHCERMPGVCQANPTIICPPDCAGYRTYRPHVTPTPPTFPASQ